MSGHTDDDIEQRIDMAKVVIEKYVRHILDKDLEAAGAYTKTVISQLDDFNSFDDIYDPVRLNDNLELSDDATDNSYDNPSSIVALGEDIKFIISSVDILVLCDGWQDSKGCIIEFMTALLFGKKVLQVIDHCTIYFLIAGSYTPITLCTLRPVSPGWGWALFGVVWGLAALAVSLTAIDLKSYSAFSMVC